MITLSPIFRALVNRDFAAIHKLSARLYRLSERADRYTAEMASDVAELQKQSRRASHMAHRLNLIDGD